MVSVVATDTGMTDLFFLFLFLLLPPGSVVVEVVVEVVVVAVVVVASTVSTGRSDSSAFNLAVDAMQHEHFPHLVLCYFF